MNYLYVIAIIIVLSGTLGGIANYYMTNVSKEFNRYDFWKSLILGIVASATVPLFLRMLSSTLLNESQNAPINYYIFGGFCLVAAVFSRKFLQSIGDKIIKDLNEVKKETEETKQKVDLVVSQSAEKDEEIELQINRKNIKAEVDDNIDQVIMALQTSPFKFRTLDGISKETQISSKEVGLVLKELRKQKVATFVLSDKRILWTLTVK